MFDRKLMEISCRIFALSLSLSLFWTSATICWRPYLHALLFSFGSIFPAYSRTFATHPYSNGSPPSIHYNMTIITNTHQPIEQFVYKWVGLLVNFALCRISFQRCFLNMISLDHECSGVWIVTVRPMWQEWDYQEKNNSHSQRTVVFAKIETFCLPLSVFVMWCDVEHFSDWNFSNNIVRFFSFFPFTFIYQTLLMLVVVSICESHCWRSINGQSSDMTIIQSICVHVSAIEIFVSIVG